MNRGSAQGKYRDTGLHRRFNEAPIHESGKFSFRVWQPSVAVVLQ